MLGGGRRWRQAWLFASNTDGFGLAHNVVTFAENVFNQYVLFTFPALNIAVALIGTFILALLVMQIPPEDLLLMPRRTVRRTPVE